MRETFDLIVIGAGLGGLCAAFEASRNGMKTLLIEQHNLPGGFATSFIRGRFEFEPSLHEMPDVQDRRQAAGVVRYLREEARLDIDFRPVPEAYRVILTDSVRDVTLPFGREPFIRAVTDAADGAAAGSGNRVRDYMDLCAHVQEAFGYLSANRADLDYRDFLRKYGNFARTGAYTAEQVADAVGLPREARDLLYPYWCYLGVPMDRVSFPIWAALLDSYTANGAVITDTSVEFAWQVDQFQRAERVSGHQIHEGHIQNGGFRTLLHIIGIMSKVNDYTDSNVRFPDWYGCFS